jgi:hypothetical protein
MIIFTAATLSFSVLTSSISYINSYIIKVIGSLTSGPSSSITFKLDIVNPCALSAMTTPSISTSIYYIFGTAHSQTLPIFT